MLGQERRGHSPGKAGSQRHFAGDRHPQGHAGGEGTRWEWGHCGGIMPGTGHESPGLGPTGPWWQGVMWQGPPAVHGAQWGMGRAHCLHQQHTVQALRHACVWVSAYPTHMGTHTQYLQLCRRHTVHCAHTRCARPHRCSTPHAGGCGCPSKAGCSHGQRGCLVAPLPRACWGPSMVLRGSRVDWPSAAASKRYQGRCGGLSQPTRSEPSFGYALSPTSISGAGCAGKAR